MQRKKKPCKGTGLSKGYGCGKMTYHRIYGLGKMCCYSDWLLNSENGKIKMQKAMLKVSKPRREFEEFKKERKNKSVISQLLESTRNVCHEYIRLRDKGKPCISCGTQWHQEFQAGHFYKAETFSTIKFNELNIHGQCVQCNIRKDGNNSEYTVRLPDRIGTKDFEHLNYLASIDKKTNFKWEREKLIEIRKYYREKIKTLK
jgi:hypothetical protein